LAVEADGATAALPVPPILAVGVAANDNGDGAGADVLDDGDDTGDNAIPPVDANGGGDGLRGGDGDTLPAGGATTAALEDDDEDELLLLDDGAVDGEATPADNKASNGGGDANPVAPANDINAGLAGIANGPTLGVPPRLRRANASSAAPTLLPPLDTVDDDEDEPLDDDELDDEDAVDAAAPAPPVGDGTTVADTSTSRVN
jgi:hypothetical protein